MSAIERIALKTFYHLNHEIIAANLSEPHTYPTVQCNPLFIVSEASLLRESTVTFSLSLSFYIYIYIYILVVRSGPGGPRKRARQNGINVRT